MFRGAVQNGVAKSILMLFTIDFHIDLKFFPLCVTGFYFAVELRLADGSFVFKRLILMEVKYKLKLSENLIHKINNLELLILS